MVLDQVTRLVFVPSGHCKGEAGVSVSHSEEFGKRICTEVSKKTKARVTESQEIVTVISGVTKGTVLRVGVGREGPSLRRDGLVHWENLNRGRIDDTVGVMGVKWRPCNTRSFGFHIRQVVVGTWKTDLTGQG